MLVSGAGHPQCHGTIERKFRTIRWAIERETVVSQLPTNEREWRYFLCALENCMRNHMLKGGYSSSQRAWGRGTSLLRTALDDTEGTAQMPEHLGIKRLIEVQETARDSFQRAVNSRKLRKLLTQTVRPSLREKEKGEEVWFRRAGRSTFDGPGRIISYDPLQEVYEVVWGAHTYRPSKYDVKGVEEPTMRSNNPTISPEGVNEDGGGGQVTGEAKEAKRLEVEEAAKQQLKAAEAKKPKTDEDGMTAARRQELLASTRRFEKVKEARWRITDKEAMDDARRGSVQSKTVEAVKLDESDDEAKSPSPELDDWNFEAPKAHEDSEEEAQGESLATPKTRARKKRRQAQKHSPVSPEKLVFHGRMSANSRRLAPVMFSDMPTCWDMCDYTPGIDVPCAQGIGKRTCFAMAVLDHEEEQFLPLMKPDEDELPILIGVRGGSDSYGMSWEDVSPEEKEASRKRGLEDYSKYEACSWDADALIPVWTIPNKDVLGAHWIDKTKMKTTALGLQVLGGRSRWVPHGYEEQVKLAIESPTASAHQLLRTY